MTEAGGLMETLPPHHDLTLSRPTLDMDTSSLVSMMVAPFREVVEPLGAGTSRELGHGEVGLEDDSQCRPT